jgi:hypothetical protein
MALAYQPPGVNVNELVTPSVSPLLAAPANVCLVGTSQGYIQRTEIVALTNEDNIVLTNFPQGNAILTAVTAVSSLTQPNLVYVEDTDYEVNYSTQVNEIQIVTIDATSGTFTLSFEDQTTADIAFGATAANVRTALEALSNIESGDVVVTGSNGGPWTITFQGQFANQDVVALTGDGSALVGGSTDVVIEEVTQGGKVATIARIDTGAIAEGETVRVVYRYVPGDYYLPTRLDELSSVEDKYGPAYDADGNPGSQVSFGAAIAFDNGASEVIIQALFRRSTDNDPTSVSREPTSAEIQSATTWEQTFYNLRDIDDINVIVPVIGQNIPGLNDSEWLAIAQKLLGHIKFMRDSQQYVVGIVGEDSSTTNTVAQRSTLRAHVQTLQSTFPSIAEQMIFVSPSKFIRVNPSSGQNYYVGGQFVAAGIAGLLAGRAVSASITRSVVSGFTGVADPRSKADKNADAQTGRSSDLPVVQVRHGVTIDNTATQRREIPVVRAKHRMIESVRDTLESQVIGQVIADGQAPAVVASTVTAVLESLKAVKDLVDYANVQARTLSLDPTTVEVRYSYKPAFPLNYVNVIFSIDLSNGTVTV